MGRKPISLEQALRSAAKRGVKDPIVKCELHNVSIRFSEMSAIAKLALEAGLDTEDRCLLLS